MKWIGQNIYDKISKFRNTVDFSEDVTFYQPINDANPNISIGASDDERLKISVNYQGTGSTTAQEISFITSTESGTANDGRMIFHVDGSNIVSIQDDGLDLYTGKGISINGTDILTDSSGTATLSNIDALDATTVSTLNAALTAGDITGVTAGTNLSGGGTSGAVTINLANASTSVLGAASFSSDNFAASSGAITIKDGGVDLTAEVTGVLPSANMDADTAHLGGIQSFNGPKTFSSPITSDGNRTLGPGDGAAIHVDTFDVTDGTTSASATTAAFRHVSIEAPRLIAANASVTTTDAATLYIDKAPIASTNQTITNAYALWVDAGNARFDGDVDVDGTLEVDAFKGTGSTTVTTISDDDTMEADSATSLATQQSIKAYADTKSLLAGSSSIVTVGTIATGVWNGTAIASAYLDADTAHLSGAQTFTGTKTLNSFKGTAGATVTNINDTDAFSDASATTLATSESIKAYVDAVKRRATFELAGYAVSDGTNYMIADIMSGNKAPFLHDETSVGANGTTADNPAAFLRTAGTVMPYAGALKIWKGWGASNGSGAVDVAIFKYTPTADDATSDSLVLVINTQFTAAGNDNLLAFSETSFSVAVAAGDILITAIKGATNNRTAYFTSTVEIEWS